ncbi:MAG: hypothetical protein AN484_24015 [Aphanizomenon flos-aquae WA102]|uniref:DUF4329 domain-containing protein n=1 Tax=Aphanizomenon flos-aquae WA102 TaxID=1710896 RepID=A0A1B7WNM1_APHFL|nr:MAG: hypothetical protein AN484_24015 [Aphanizomenon flos-aquae WA102]
MNNRQHIQKKHPSQSTYTPIQNLYQTRAFDIQQQPSHSSSGQENVDLDADHEQSQYNRPTYPNIPVNAPGTEPPPPIQTQLNSGEPTNYYQQGSADVPWYNRPTYPNIPVNAPATEPPPPIQTKLTIGQPGDKYEQEADQVASQVVQQINSPVSEQSAQGQTVQREEVPEEEEQVQAKSISDTIQRLEAPEEEEQVQAKSIDLKSILQSLIRSGTNYTQVKTAIQAASATDKTTVLADQTLLTSLQGALSWNDFARSVELLGRQAPDYNTLITDATVTDALTTAWTNSNPAVPGLGTTQHEEGGWIYLNLITGNISVTSQTSGGQASINLSSPPTVANSIVVGKFHTHPNLGPDWEHGPSPGDLTVDAQHGVPDIVVASPTPPPLTYYQSGPVRRLHLGGNQGLPGSAGGVAPQAKKDGSHDEQ